ncbi:MAG: hypothetical protein D6687_05370 [Acidobacteria bacterium]|jgi:hypothetical protein|nr:MAG: hypothetical protein D6687_05370 [Acidobacteriota bacterium]GIU82777.1 MAG: hypothetical protein KatS3mg006_1841 [Pyrinomonadaceae bacterium]
MKNHNFEIRDCGFGEKLVSYLYDELEETEREEFEGHLQACKVCFNELRAFDEVRFALSEWRQNDFEHLTLPKIEISKSHAGQIASVLSEFWERLFLRRWIVLASVCLLIALGLVFFTSQSGEEIALFDENVQKELASVRESATVVKEELTEEEKEIYDDGASLQDRSTTNNVEKRQNEVKIKPKPQLKKKGNRLNRSKPIEEDLIDLPDFQEERIRLVDIFDEIGGI